MTFEEYRLKAKRTIPDGVSRLEMECHSMSGMVSEIGELHGLYQKEYQGHRFDREHAKKELGDLLWFMAEYCTAMGWSFDDVAATNIDKLMARYPSGFDAEHSLHRREGDV